MAKRVQLNRMATAQASTFIGLQGEVIVDTGTFTLRVQDGLTAGGFQGMSGANNLAEIANPATARTNLGLGSAATQATSAFDVAGTAAAVQTACFQITNNFSEISNAATCRTNLGLGTAAVANTTAFDAAGAAATAQAASLQKTSNLSDLASAATARTNLGLGAAATQGLTTWLQTSNNLSDLGNAGTARTNLGLGTSATVNTGTSGATIPLFSGNNTWSGTNLFSATIAVSATIQFNSSSSVTMANSTVAGLWRTALLLGTAATHPSTDFLLASNNLSDLGSIANALTTLGIFRTVYSGNAITAGGLVTINHNLGFIPRITTYLQCVTGELGYNAGALVLINPHTQTSSNLSQGIAWNNNTTQASGRFGSNGNTFNILRGDTGNNAAITNANWTLQVWLSWP